MIFDTETYQKLRKLEKRVADVKKFNISKEKLKLEIEKIAERLLSLIDELQ